MRRTEDPAPTVSADAVQRARRIALVGFDVDGTLTDGSIVIGPQGEAMKRFDVRDGLGLVLLRRAGLRIAIVTGRRSEIVERRAEELGFDHVLQAVQDKRAALDALCAQQGIGLAQCAFIGDDWPDLPALRAAGLAATVAGAPAEVRQAAHWIGTRPPGYGAVREFCEWLLTAQGRLEGLLEDWRR
jgi:3-deoxy-D-manno-octulosonate 8-phosphate phosphatase (KDO 8-P phosphatase)